MCDFKKLAAARFSVRKFSEREVEQETLDKILEIGNLAPTAQNKQPHRIYVLKSETALSKLNALTKSGYGAKTVLLFTYNEDEDWKNPLQEGIHSGAEDVSIVATHIMLAAAEMGVGTCWCNYFANAELEKAFGLPENERSVILMPIGYPADGVSPTPMHTKKKPLGNIVKYL